ncbi:dihydrofolate reductase family protein [Actinoplanes awajinensis]|uniref:Riboflavin biosynthesis protein RibD n=1 Tax=Actinoplanes awajinensis subsp. mycoplanecinus TaxID=135947 RepID=A0A101J8U6_9ACTN|nr:dihydrofolate reductase family protein [Actinoplanes awajinensis]KUL22365.1 riboflavin biosynthesis protein RibD [Actinoplanes awajinensis subsp. mycoplanecinus]
MGDIIVIAFCTLDGVASDPDGRGGTSHGGWAFRHGTGPVSDDRFGLGPRMDRGVHLYGRKTWENFAKVWPSREGDYARRMNAVPKAVATRTGIDAAAWQHSQAIDGDAITWAKAERADRDIVVIGSLSVVHALAAADLVDEYRLVTFPIVTGSGDPLFAAGRPAEFRFTHVEPGDVTTLTILRRA